MKFLSDKQKKQLDDFVKFVADELKFKSNPKIIVQNGRNNLKTTANYDYDKDEKVIRVNGKNRMIVDVMRSIAHEMVHHKQFEDGKLKIKPADIDSDPNSIEGEANAKAGAYIKMYSKMDNTIYDE